MPVKAAQADAASAIGSVCTCQPCVALQRACSVDLPLYKSPSRYVFGSMVEHNAQKRPDKIKMAQMVIHVVQLILYS
jgi:hypothetical protein